MSRTSLYQRAINESMKMKGRDQRSSKCSLYGKHEPHVSNVLGSDYRGIGRYCHEPCGGGDTKVDVNANGRSWEKP
jgi:hypothetical protein